MKAIAVSVSAALLVVAALWAAEPETQQKPSGNGPAGAAVSKGVSG